MSDFLRVWKGILLRVAKGSMIFVLIGSASFAYLLSEYSGYGYWDSFQSVLLIWLTLAVAFVEIRVDWTNEHIDSIIGFQKSLLEVLKVPEETEDEAIEELAESE